MFRLKLRISLRNDFDRTVWVIRNEDDLRDSTFESIRKYIYDTSAVRNNFVINRHNLWLLEYDKDLLMLSLENNYEETFSQFQFMDLDIKRIGHFVAKSIKQNDSIRSKFVIDNNTAWLLNFDEELLKISLDNDLKTTIDWLPKCFANNIGDKNRLFGIMVDYVKNNFEKVENVLPNFLAIIDDDKIVDVVKEIQIFLIPDHIIAKEKFLRFSISNIRTNQIQAIQNIISNSAYNENLEREFLSVVNGDFSSIEDYIKSFAFSGLNMKDMSILQRIGLKLYCQKQLSKEGINDVSVTFSVEKKDTILGDYDDERRTIKIYLSSLQYYPVKTMLSAIAHEKNHAIQFFNIRNGNIDKDLDVLVYCKDEILREIDKNYYERNYRSISIEFDAQYNAEKEIRELEGIDVEYLYQESCREIEEAVLENREALLETKDNPYRYEVIRKDSNDNYYGQETLFRMELKRKLQKTPSYKEHIEQKYPIIALGYDLDDFGRARSLEEMLAIIDNSDDNRVKKLCWFIIKERFDPGRFSKEERSLMYDDYEMIRSYEFRDSKMKTFAQSFADAVESRSEMNSKNKFVRNLN